MEQCAARLDVAIFNALLRDTTEYVPTDPISDPIGDASVLPVAPGKLTFGDGAQLKNAVSFELWSSFGECIIRRCLRSKPLTDRHSESRLEHGQVG